MTRKNLKPKTKMNHLTIENRKGKLRLNDGVYKESADKLIEELDRLYGPAAVAAQMKIGDVVCSADEALESVEVEINSPGGSVFEGQRIFNALRQMSARGVEITTTVNGLAASMGSVILMAGDKRQMTHGSRVMIHEASTIACGDARTMRKNADLLEGISAEIAGIYAERTGGDPKAIRNLMLAETWMTADEAKENGFVHAVIKNGKSEDDKKSASAQLDIRAGGLISTSMNLLAKLFPGKDESEIEAALIEVDSLRNDLSTATAEIETLKAEITAKDQTIAEHIAALASKDELIAEVEAKLADADKLANENAQAITDLQEQVEQAKAAASKEAVEALASIGQPAPLAIDEKQTESHLEAFNKLTGENATAYWKKFSKEIKAEQRAQSKK